jgi:putative chitinase
MAILLTDVAKFYRGESHQIKALTWLQDKVEPSVLEQFADIWRTPDRELLTPSQLFNICDSTSVKILNPLCAELNRSFRTFKVDTKLRIAHFIAQAAHESDGFRTFREYASGEEYEGREDLGNTQPGDGVRFAGKGIFQITGRYNVEECGKALAVDLIANPELLAELPLCVESAFWYWNTRDLSRYADADDIEAITRRINGGLNGFEQRKEYLARAKAELGI